MATEAKTQPTKESLKSYLSRIEDEARRKDCEIIASIMEHETGEKPVMWGTGIVGFGKYTYKYASGQTGDWPIIGFASRKTDITLYVMTGIDSVKELLKNLGKHKSSKACLYIKRLSDVDMPTLKAIVKESVKGMEPQRVR